MSNLTQTVFHAWHEANGGRMVEFGGWHMPVQYTSIVDEHHGVRKHVGLFDVAHMGRIKFTGPDDCRFLDYLLTNDVSALEVGQVRYSLITNEEGGVLDDVLVYRFDSFYMLVVNASNRIKIVDWLNAHQSGFDVAINDLTEARAMLAIQGPNAGSVVEKLGCSAALDLKYYSVTETQFTGHDAFVSRTGYTGEDGYEVIVDTDKAVEVWERIVEAGQEFGLVAAGLGCRDTLRLESAMPLYGHELDEATDPITAGLKFAVKLNVAEFIGKSALSRISETGTKVKRVGVAVEGRRIAREGSTIHVGDTQVGRLTSGTFSPTFEKPIGMGYVEHAHAEIGTAVEVDIRGKRVAAEIVKLPFYKRG
jgi:aminomethyltransferase